MIQVRSAARSLFRTPLVTGAAVLSLALGLGANAAIYSLFQRLILESLPVAEPERLVNLLSPGPKSGSQSSNQAGDVDAIWSYPMFRDLEAIVGDGEVPVASIAGERLLGANLSAGQSTEAGTAALVSGSYFATLGMNAAIGRLFGPDDDRTPGAHPVAVLDHTYWTTRLGADPGVLGRTLVVNGYPMTVVGVAPRAFAGRTVGSRPDVYVPLTMQPQVIPGWFSLERRDSYWLYVFARLPPGASPEAATAALTVPYRRILAEVELPLHDGMSDNARERFLAKEIVPEPGGRGQSTIREEVTTPFLLLLGVTGLVLLIACANIVNLLLVRAARREGEIAVRLSLGARRHHIVLQLLVESFLLAVAGGVVGLGVALATLGLFRRLIPEDAGVEELLHFGPAAWTFLAVLTLVTALVGLFPAVHATRRDLALTLKGQGGRGGGSRGANRFRTVLATVQIAMSMTLLVSAGLFLRSLLNVGRVDLGMETARLATFTVSPERSGQSYAEARSLFARLESDLATIPGVTSVVVSRVPLLSGNNWGSNVTVQGFDAGPDTDTNARYNEVGPGYFATLGMPLLAGRDFTAADDLGAPKVVVVNASFAEKFGLGRDAVGKSMTQGSGDVELDTQIVGLVADAKYSEVKDAAPPLFFLPYRQNEAIGEVAFYLRTPGDPERLLPEIRTTVRRLAPDLPVESLATLATTARENVFLDRFLTALSAGFAVLATVLAAIGLYGVIAYSVAQRTREIGLRMALGADAPRVRGMVLRQVLAITAVGATVGILAAFALGRVAASLLYDLEGHDPLAFTGAAVALALVALAAGLVPAQRAARVDPLVALREE